MFKISVLRLLVLLWLVSVYSFSGNVVEAFDDNSAMNPASLHKGNSLKIEKMKIGTRKLLAEPYHAVLDYDYAGANPKHEPRKGKPGGGW